VQFDFTEEQDALRGSVRAVLERECPISLVREVVEKTVAGGTPDAPARLWQQMTELGWPALTIPADDGGLGLGAVELAVVVEELGRAIAPGPFLATVTQFVPLLMEAGDATQRARFLAAIVGGGTGTLAATGITAHADADGDGGWVLEGTSRHVVDAATADEVAIVASVDDADGAAIGVFIVPQADVVVEPVRALDASRPLGTVRVDGVAVPPDRVLGEPGSSSVAGAVRRATEVATVALAMEMVGTCQTIFDVSLAYAKVREQFGVPIGSFQAMKHKYADMLVALEKARVCAYFGALTIAEDDDRRTLAAAMAKAAAGDCQRLLTQEGIQTLGGIGYTWEHDMHLYVKRATSGEALFGGTHAHRARIAELIGLDADSPA
jgi:alkylation response protein AidB-like acyl-CoA dehydrogenase